MNKTAVKSFAVWARRKLISEITYRAGLLGVTENGAAEPLPQSTKDLQFFDVGTKKTAEVQGEEIAQRSALVAAIQSKARDMDYKAAFQSVVEEVAYTWFNRMAAIRFMEVNDYLPARIRVLSSENPGKLEPDLVTTPFDAELGLTPAEQEQVLRLKDENRLDELFRMLFIKQCNRLHELLPELFEATSDYTELLLTLSFTDKDGVVYHLTHDIPESDFDIAHTDENGKTPGQVEIIGWLYQYYNTEPKDEVFALLKKNVKITKERIPAATQLFTPDWIVRYMVENSLGRLFVNAQCSAGSEQRTEAERIEKEKELAGKMGWKYYLPEAEQTPEVRARLAAARTSQAMDFQVEDLKIIDPCMGSGHILVYAFDVLMQIYEAQGYTQRDAARLIVEKNLCGLDIDRRAYQLACFAVMMKARQYNRRILNGGVRPNLYAIGDSAALTGGVLDFIADGSETQRADLQSIADDLAGAKEYGSIIDVSPVDFDALLARFEELRAGDSGDLFEAANRQLALNTVLPLVRQAQVMAQKYDVVVTNPPYMGASGMSEKLSGYVKKYYPDSKSDLFAVFIERCGQMTNNSGIVSMITPQSFFFLSGLESLRRKFEDKNTFINATHMGLGAFGTDFGTIAFVFLKVKINKYDGKYIYLGNAKSVDEKEILFMSGLAPVYFHNMSDFAVLPNNTYSYIIDEKTLAHFNNEPLSCHFMSGGRNKTHNDEKYLRLHWEIAVPSNKWVSYGKGGEFRKWYGNEYYVVNWSESAREYYASHGGLCHSRFWGHVGITWSFVTSYKPSFRYKRKNMIYSSVSPTIFRDDFEFDYFIIALLNSNVGTHFLDIISSTIGTNVGEVLNFPVLRKNKTEIESISEQSIKLSQEDWDSYEISWDFMRHPLV